MLTFRTSIRVDGITGIEVFEFLADPDDASYQTWWPGTHRQLHTLKRGADGHVGDLVHMDEYVGTRRLRMAAVVTEAVHGRRLAWQLKKLIRLPAWLFLELDDYEDGVAITHTTRAGFRGVGRVLDPVLRLFFSKEFVRELDQHVRTEFPLLRDLLHSDWSDHASEALTRDPKASVASRRSGRGAGGGPLAAPRT